MRFKKVGYISFEVVTVAACVMIFGLFAVSRFVFQGQETTDTTETTYKETYHTAQSTNPGYVRPSDPGPEGGSGGSGGGSVVDTYYITYELNDGVQENGAVLSYTEDTETFDLPVPTKENYEFEGWYETEDFSDTSVSQIVKGTTGNKTFYAKWKQVLGSDGCELVDIVNGVERTTCNTFFWDGKTTGLSTINTFGGNTKMAKISSNTLDLSEFITNEALVEVISLTTGEVGYLTTDISYINGSYGTGYTVGFLFPLYTGPVYGTSSNYIYVPSKGTWVHYGGTSTFNEFESGESTYKTSAITIQGFDWTGKLD